MTSTSLAGTSAPVAYSTPYRSADAVYDEHNNALFYVLNHQVFDGSGSYAFDLPTYRDPEMEFAPGGCPASINNWLNKGIFTGEIAIAPVPGSCDRKYYVVYNLSANAMGSNVIVYITIEVTPTGLLVMGATNVTSYPSQWCGPHTNPTLIELFPWTVKTEIAISKTINTANERYLFAAGQNGVYRYTMRNNGIHSKQTIISATVNNSTLSLPDNSFNARDLELSPNQLYLSWASDAGSPTNDRNIYVIRLNNYNYYSIKKFASTTDVNGLEFNAASTHLLASMDNKIFWWPIIGSPVLTAVQNSENCGNSNIEEDAIGGYVVAKNNELKRIVWNSSLANYEVLTTGSTTPCFSNDNWFSTAYRLPNQISGESYQNFIGVAPAVSVIKVNNTGSVPCSSALSLYPCNDITLSHTLTGTAVSYRLEIKSMSDCNTYTSGTGNLGTYSSGQQASFATIGNLKALPGANGNWLSDSEHAGLYEINLYSRNACGVDSKATTYLNLLANPSAALVNLQFNSGGSLCDGNSIATKCALGDFAGSFNIGSPGANTFGSLNIDQVAFRVDEVNCSTGAILSTPLPPVLLTVPPTTYYSGYPINELVIGGANGYFAGKDNRCFKLTVTGANACGFASDSGYFWLDPTKFRPAPLSLTTMENKIPENSISLEENPVNHKLSLSAILLEPVTVNYELLDSWGRSILKGKYSGHAGWQTIKIDVNDLAAGVYYYRAGIAGQVFNGRFVKQ